jgi:hypothetical protein
MLDFSGKPENFVLIASFDETTTLKNKIMQASKAIYFDNSFSIVGKKEIASCIQDCTVCSACWIGKGLILTVNVH